MFNSPARDGFFPPKKSDGKKARVASILIFFFGGKECNTHQHPLDAPPGGIGRAMMSSLRFSISRFAPYMGNSGPHPIWEMLPRGQKKSNRHRNTSCVVFSPQSVSQQSVWALKVRFGKIDFSICTQGPVGCDAICTHVHDVRAS